MDFEGNELEGFEDPELNALGLHVVFKDAITGQLLDLLVRLARNEELAYFESKGVLHKRPRSEAYQRMGRPPITVKWVDTNKGDDANPKYKSHLVAREVRHAGEETIFAPTREGRKC